MHYSNYYSIKQINTYLHIFLQYLIAKISVLWSFIGSLLVVFILTIVLFIYQIKSFDIFSQFSKEK